MKKTLLALTVLAAATSSAWAQSSVTLYGIVDVAVRHTTNEPTSSITRVIGGGMSQSRLGVNVTEDMGDGMKALANLETRINADEGQQGSSNFWQQSWVGLQGGFGRVTLGRQYNVLFDLVTSTYASYPYSPYMDAYKPEIGLSLGARNDNMVKYLIEMGPVRGAVQVSAGEGSATGGKSMGGYVRYSDAGLAAGIGYQNREFGSGKKVKATTFGASYRTGPWYTNVGYAVNKVDSGLTATDMAVLGSIWGAGGGSSGGFGGPAFLVANERTMWTFGAGYQLTPQLNLGAHYFHAKQSGVTAAADATAKFLTFAADYALSKRTDAYVELDNTKLTGAVSLNGSATGPKSRNGMTVGIRHRF